MCYDIGMAKVKGAINGWIGLINTMWSRHIKGQRIIVTTRVMPIGPYKPTRTIETFIENRTKNIIEINEVRFVTDRGNFYRRNMHDKNPPVTIVPNIPKEAEDTFAKRVIFFPFSSTSIDCFESSIREHFNVTCPKQKIKDVYAIDSTGHPYKGRISREVHKYLGI